MCEIWGHIGVENGLPSCYSSSSEVAYEFVGPPPQGSFSPRPKCFNRTDYLITRGHWKIWCWLMTRPCGVLALSPGRKCHRRIGELHLKECDTLFSVCRTSWIPVLEFSHFCYSHMLVLYSTAGRHDRTYLPLLATKNFFVPYFDRLPLRVTIMLKPAVA